MIPTFSETEFGLISIASERAVLLPLPSFPFQFHPSFFPSIICRFDIFGGVDIRIRTGERASERSNEVLHGGGLLSRVWLDHIFGHATYSIKNDNLCLQLLNDFRLTELDRHSVCLSVCAHSTIRSIVASYRIGDRCSGRTSFHGRHRRLSPLACHPPVFDEPRPPLL